MKVWREGHQRSGNKSNSFTVKVYGHFNVIRTYSSSLQGHRKSYTKWKWIQTERSHSENRDEGPVGVYKKFVNSLSVCDLPWNPEFIHIDKGKCYNKRKFDVKEQDDLFRRNAPMSLRLWTHITLLKDWNVLTIVTPESDTTFSFPRFDLRDLRTKETIRALEPVEWVVRYGGKGLDILLPSL